MKKEKVMNMGLTMRYLKKWIETQDWHALELYYQERVFENWKLGLHNGKKIGIKIGKLRGIKIGKQETNEIIAKKCLKIMLK